MKVLLTSLIGFKGNIIIDFLIEVGIKKSDIYIKTNNGFTNNLNDSIELNEGVNFNKKIKKLFLCGNLKKCCVSSAFLDSYSRIGNDKIKENDYYREKVFVSNFINQQGKRLLAQYEKDVLEVNEHDFLNVKFENLIGENEREFQINEYQKVVNYIGLEIDNTELESKISNILNVNNYNFVFSNYNYDFYLNKTFYKKFKSIGFNKLNKRLGYKKPKNIVFKIFSNISNPKQSSFYDKYWKVNKRNVSLWSYGINIVDNLIENYKFKTVLDAGCGSADVVRYFLSKGFDAKGIELSNNVLRTHASDLLKSKIVSQGSLDKLPYDDKIFDVIFSSEVLEHIPEDDIPSVIKEFYRVSKKYVFLTISLRPSSNFNKYHITLKNRDWWENEFLKAGFEKDNLLVEKLQEIKKGASNQEVLEIGPTKSHIHEMDWFIKKPPLEFNGELEPWYFIFKKGEK